MEPVLSYRGAAARSLAEAGGIEGAMKRNERRTEYTSRYHDRGYIDLTMA